MASLILWYLGFSDEKITCNLNAQCSSKIQFSSPVAQFAIFFS